MGTHHFPSISSGISGSWRIKELASSTDATGAYPERGGSYDLWMPFSSLRTSKWELFFKFWLRTSELESLGQRSASLRSSLLNIPFLSRISHLSALFLRLSLRFAIPVKTLFLFENVPFCILTWLFFGRSANPANWRRNYQRILMIKGFHGGDHGNRGSQIDVASERESVFLHSRLLLLVRCELADHSEQMYQKVTF